MKAFQTYLNEGALKSKDMDTRNDYRDRLVKMIKAGDKIKLQAGGEVVLKYANDDVKKVLEDKLRAPKEISKVGIEYRNKLYQFKGSDRKFYKLTHIMKSGQFSAAAGFKDPGKPSGADWENLITKAFNEMSGKTDKKTGKVYGYWRLKKQFTDQVKRLASPQVSVIDRISNTLPEDAIVVQGMTNIGYWSSAAMPMHTPRNYVTSSYFGTLGYAYPTALGCQTAYPDRKVIALCGDGGFMYSPQELSTAMRYGLNTVAVVFNNGAYGASRWDQQHQFNGRYIGTDLFNPDFVAMAKSFGAEGIKTDADNIEAGLKAAIALEKPTLLEVEIQNMMPPFQIVE